MLAQMPNLPSFPLEWVREDNRVVQENGGVLPVPPGIYYITIEHAPTAAQEEGSFMVDALVSVNDGPVLRFVSGVEKRAHLEHLPLPGSLRLWLNGRTLLIEGEDYTRLGQDITFTGVFYPSNTVTADYHYEAPSFGPFPFTWNHTNRDALPGVVLAFGKRAMTGDQVLVVVTRDREDAAEIYGGKFELGFDLDVIARDPIQMEEVADLAVMYLWAIKKGLLEDEGIEILDISSGSEGEEAYDETGKEIYYTASLSVSMRSDWEVHVPLPLTMARVIPGSGTPGDPGVEAPPASSIFFSTAPIIAGRGSNYERIG